MESSGDPPLGQGLCRLGTYTSNFSMQAIIIIGVLVDPTAMARSAASLVLSARSYPARGQVQRLYAKYELG